MLNLTSVFECDYFFNYLTLRLLCGSILSLWIVSVHVAFAFNVNKAFVSLTLPVNLVVFYI